MSMNDSIEDKDPTIQTLLCVINGTGSDKEYEAVRRLRNEIGEDFPKLMLEHYNVSKLRGARAACIFFSFPYARLNPYAKKLGLKGISDNSKIVRYRAFQLLAYSQDKSLLNEMEKLRSNVAKESLPDFDAAADAISNQNQNYFKDREHTGKIFMELSNFSK
jgi:hypothetical protein